MEKAMTGEPLWYVSTLQDVTSALQKLVGERFRVYVIPEADGAQVIVNMGPDQPAHRVMRLTTSGSTVTLTGFKGTTQHVPLGPDGKPEDESVMEEAVLAVLTDVTTLVQVCRSLG
jgi:hypothetical protein